jgi:hypothetical protein
VQKALLHPQWFWVTRLIGTIVLLYGVFGDASDDRGTLILTGAGLLGIDKVARSEPHGEAPEKAPDK